MDLRGVRQTIQDSKRGLSQRNKLSECLLTFAAAILFLLLSR